MTLINKLKKSIGALGLAGLISSCAPMTPEEQQKSDERMLMLVTGYGSIVEPDPQRAAVMGLTSQIIRDYDVAREGRSQTEINIVNRENNKTNIKRIEGLGKTRYSTAFKKWVDKNNDGDLTASELEGAGGNFSLSNLDEISFGTLISGENRKYAFLSIYSPSGNLLYTGEGIKINSDK